MKFGFGGATLRLVESDVREIMEQTFAALALEGKRVLVIVPDGTRTAPIAMFTRLFRQLLESRVNALHFLVALGTHPRMTEERIRIHFGLSEEIVNGQNDSIKIFNHQWNTPEELITIGSIAGEEIQFLTCGLMTDDLPISINKRILDYDIVFVCGPVFPHEIAGFSGGDKYFFPGISGPEAINYTHWLGALLTSMAIIGSPDNAVRAVIKRAAAFIPVPRIYFNLVVAEDGLAGLFVGDSHSSWLQAVEVSAALHVRVASRRYQQVLSIMPATYDDLWTAAKGMYKVEPVVSDGGEVIIFAPQIHEISYTHGDLIERLGYHVRDYYLKQWEQFKDFPWLVLAHSTHLRGSGEFDIQTQKEKSRIRVTLATGIPKERCERVQLGYLDPQEVQFGDYENREEQGILLVPRAGETLYRYKGDFNYSAPLPE